MAKAVAQKERADKTDAYVQKNMSPQAKSAVESRQRGWGSKEKQLSRLATAKSAKKAKGAVQTGKRGGRFVISEGGSRVCMN
jgi:hypothetical protein